MHNLVIIHVLFVVLSGLGFLYRGIVTLWWANRPYRGWLRWAPHINDSALLVTGIANAWIIGWNPLHHPWLAVKLIALIVYIGLGSIAIGSHIRLSRSLRITAWFLALATFGYMVMVAISKTPTPWNP